MIDVELSNIWGSVSLPDLLSGKITGENTQLPPYGVLLLEE